MNFSEIQAAKSESPSSTHSETKEISANENVSNDGGKSKNQEILTKNNEKPPSDTKQNTHTKETRIFNKDSNKSNSAPVSKSKSTTIPQRLIVSKRLQSSKPNLVAEGGRQLAQKRECGPEKEPVLMLTSSPAKATGAHPMPRKSTQNRSLSKQEPIHPLSERPSNPVQHKEFRVLTFRSSANLPGSSRADANVQTARSEPPNSNGSGPAHHPESQRTKSFAPLINHLEFIVSKMDKLPPKLRISPLSTLARPCLPNPDKITIKSPRLSQDHLSSISVPSTSAPHPRPPWNSSTLPPPIERRSTGSNKRGKSKPAADGSPDSDTAGSNQEVESKEGRRLAQPHEKAGPITLASRHKTTVPPAPGVNKVTGTREGDSDRQACNSGPMAERPAESENVGMHKPADKCGETVGLADETRDQSRVGELGPGVCEGRVLSVDAVSQSLQTREDNCVDSNRSLGELPAGSDSSGRNAVSGNGSSDGPLPVRNPNKELSSGGDCNIEDAGNLLNDEVDADIDGEQQPPDARASQAEASNDARRRYSTAESVQTEGSHEEEHEQQLERAESIQQSLSPEGISRPESCIGDLHDSGAIEVLGHNADEDASVGQSNSIRGTDSNARPEEHDAEPCAAVGDDAEYQPDFDVEPSEVNKDEIKDNLLDEQLEERTDHVPQVEYVDSLEDSVQLDQKRSTNDVDLNSVRVLPQNQMSAFDADSISYQAGKTSPIEQEVEKFEPELHPGIEEYCSKTDPDDKRASENELVDMTAEAAVSADISAAKIQDLFPQGASPIHDRVEPVSSGGGIENQGKSASLQTVDLMHDKTLPEVLIHERGEAYDPDFEDGDQDCNDHQSTQSPNVNWKSEVGISKPELIETEGIQDLPQVSDQSGNEIDVSSRSPDDSAHSNVFPDNLKSSLLEGLIHESSESGAVESSESGAVEESRSQNALDPVNERVYSVDEFSDFPLVGSAVSDKSNSDRDHIITGNILPLQKSIVVLKTEGGSDSPGCDPESGQESKSVILAEERAKVDPGVDCVASKTSGTSENFEVLDKRSLEAAIESAQRPSILHSDSEPYVSVGDANHSEVAEVDNITNTATGDEIPSIDETRTFEEITAEKPGTQSIVLCNSEESISEVENLQTSTQMLSNIKKNIEAEAVCSADIKNIPVTAGHNEASSGEVMSETNTLVEGKEVISQECSLTDPESSVHASQSKPRADSSVSEQSLAAESELEMVSNTQIMSSAEGNKGTESDSQRLEAQPDIHNNNLGEADVGMFVSFTPDESSHATSQYQEDFETIAPDDEGGEGYEASFSHQDTTAEGKESNQAKILLDHDDDLLAVHYEESWEVGDNDLQEHADQSLEFEALPAPREQDSML